jgi:hypothetical protein
MSGVSEMVVYRRKKRHVLGRWILAAVIFIIVMSVTFADVEGAVPAALDLVLEICR